MPDGQDLTRRQLMERLGMVGAGAFVSQSALAWMAGPSWASAIERAAQDQAGRLGPRGGRAHRLPDAREPLLRPLLRRLPARPRLRRSPQALARRVRPGLPGRLERRPQAQAAAVPPAQQPRPRVDRGPDPRLGPDARVLEPRQDGLLGEGPHPARVGGAQGRDDDGLLHARRSCRSTGRSPTTSRSGTPTTARSSARRTPTG